jgi:hypothetical protein
MPFLTAHSHTSMVAAEYADHRLTCMHWGKCVLVQRARSGWQRWL